MEPLSTEIDLKGLEFMPLDVLRLADSDLVAISTGDEFKAAVLLWCKSWHQIPAGSIPNDDRVLARLSGAGKDWMKVREVALHGWELAADGRLHHPLIEAKAMEAWKHRTRYREKREKDAERLKEWRRNADETRTKRVSNEFQANDETEVKRVSNDVRNADETRKRGRGTERGTDKEIKQARAIVDETEMKRVSRSAEIAVFLKAENVFGVNPHHAFVMAWASDGVTDNELRSALSTARERKGPNARIALGYIDGIIRSERQTSTPKLTGANKHGNFNERDYKADETPDSEIGWLPHAENG